MLDVEAIPTQELIAELVKRCSPACFIGTKYNIEDGGKGQWESFFLTAGREETCRGLLKELDAELERKILRDELERANG